jgi:hypothetical protein
MALCRWAGGPPDLVGPRFGKAGKAESAQAKPNISEGNVKVMASGNQINGDQKQP